MGTPAEDENSERDAAGPQRKGKTTRSVVNQIGRLAVASPASAIHHIHRAEVLAVDVLNEEGFVVHLIDGHGDGNGERHQSR